MVVGPGSQLQGDVLTPAAQHRCDGAQVAAGSVVSSSAVEPELDAGLGMELCGVLGRGVGGDPVGQVMSVTEQGSKPAVVGGAGVAGQVDDGGEQVAVA